MTHVRLVSIADALRRAGLLVAEEGALPQVVDAITDDNVEPAHAIAVRRAPSAEG